MSFLFWLYILAGVFFSVFYEYIPTRETIYSLGAWALFAIGVFGWLPILIIIAVGVYLEDKGRW